MLSSATEFTETSGTDPQPKKKPVWHRQNFNNGNRRLLPLHQALTGALSSLDPAKPVFGGFSAARDIVLSVAGDAFLALQESAGYVPPAPGAAKAALETLTDIIDCFAACVAAGHGSDLPLASPAVGRPLADFFPHTIRVGGTGVQVANCLAHCGFTNVTAHVPFLAPEMREILHPAIRLAGNNRHYERSAKGIPEGAGFAGVHYILDYAAGAAVRTGEGILRARRPDRIILGGNPYTAALRISPEFLGFLSVPRRDSSMVMAGFAAPRDLVAFHDFAGDCLDALTRYRRANPDGFVHVEECHHAVQPRERRILIRENIWPRIDSLGMNESEFAVLADFLRLDAGDVWGSLHAIASRHGLKRACLHTGEVCRTVSRYGFAEECRAVGMGILFASARAHYGRFAQLEDIRLLLDAAEPIAGGLAIPDPKTLGDGYLAIEIPTLRGLPVKSSIGLGDAFTAGIAAFL